MSKGWRHPRGKGSWESRGSKAWNLGHELARRQDKRYRACHTIHTTKNSLKRTSNGLLQGRVVKLPKMFQVNHSVQWTLESRAVPQRMPLHIKVREKNKRDNYDISLYQFLKIRLYPFFISNIYYILLYNI